MNVIEVPRWFVETIENTLRIQNNINLDKNTGETCQDRNIREVLNGVRKLLNGEELTGMERLEKLQPFLPDNLDEAAEYYMKKARKHLFDDSPIGRTDDAFKAGAEWQKGQMMKEAVEGEIVKDISNKLAVTAKNVNLDGFKFGDKVKIIIVKKKEEET